MTGPDGVLSPGPKCGPSFPGSHDLARGFFCFQPNPFDFCLNRTAALCYDGGAQSRNICASFSCRIVFTRREAREVMHLTEEDGG
jgi:hypothetical protein